MPFERVKQQSGGEALQQQSWLLVTAELPMLLLLVSTLQPAADKTSNVQSNLPIPFPPVLLLLLAYLLPATCLNIQTRKVCLSAIGGGSGRFWTGSSSWQQEVPRWDEEGRGCSGSTCKTGHQLTAANLTAPFHSAVPICRRILVDGYLAIEK